MARDQFSAGDLFASDDPVTEPNARFLMLMGAATAPILVVALLVPPAAALPVLGIICVLSGLAFSFVAWMSGTRWHDRYITTWDVAGALLFVGFAASMVSDPLHFIALTDGGVAMP